MALIMHKRSKYWQIVIYNPAAKKHKWISSGTEDKFEAIKMEAMSSLRVFYLAFSFYLS